MRFLTMVPCVFLIAFQVLAGDEKSEVRAYLPLFERNSIERKVLDVSYSYVCGSKKKDVHLVFDTASGKYREETKAYENPNDPDAYRFEVLIWNGKECVRWFRFVSKRPGSRALGQGVYEDSGQASIRSRCEKTPYFAEIFYAGSGRPFAKTVLQRDPKIGHLDGDAITIDTMANTFRFSRKSGALEKLVCYSYTNDRRKNAWKTCDLSNHAERSGVWIPLHISTQYYRLGKALGKVEISVDPKTLRLLDKADDSLFKVTFPAGCSVDDRIRGNVYVVPTAGHLPKDAEAMEQILDKMLEQSRKQKK